MIAVGALLAMVALAVLPAGAQAQTAGSSPPMTGLTPVIVDKRPPEGRTRTANAVRGIARRVPKVREALRRHPGAFARVYLREPRRWQVSFYVRASPQEREIAQVLVADRTGRVLQAWTGIQVRWTMARGKPGAFGRKADALYVWLPLLALFLLPFLRPPWRMLHLDLAVLAAMSVSVAFFNHGLIRASIPLAYPPVVYLMIRLLALARARGRPGGMRPRPPLRLLLGPEALVVGVVFLLGFRLALQAVGSNVIDVGYAGVIGADHITDGLPLYGSFPSDNVHGDTYGPLNYLAYVPFEALWPWSGTWDDLPAAHAAAAVFDLACVGLLWRIGRGLRGPRLGVLLAYLWLACPFTLMAANSGANDPLVGAFVLAALAGATAPARRGIALAAAGLTKFAPLALVPLFALHPGRAGDRSASSVARTLLAAAVTVVAGLGVVLLTDGGLHRFWEQTVVFQADRDSPFSLWGLYDLPTLQHLVQAAGVVLALAVAVVPRRRDAVSLAALTAAVLIGLQLGVSHWFYLYLTWFLGPLFVALLAPYADPPDPPRPQPSAPLADERPVAA